MYKSMYEIIAYQEQYPNIESIKNVCEKYESIKKWAIILHNKDEKKTHYHIALHFGRSFESDRIIQMFDITATQLGPIKGRWSDVLKYLTHENRPEKYQYEENHVISNFDFAGDKQINDRKDFINATLNQYADLEIGYYELWNRLTTTEKRKYDREIEKVYKIRQTNIKMEGNREMKVIYIKGKAGSGKTTFAKFYADEILKKPYYITSSSNDALQDYMGEPVIIMDDLRGDSFKYNDLLKMLDNHTNSSVKSRYVNKSIDCELIIITSVNDIFDLYSYEIQEKDDYSQLLRRISEFITIDDNGYIKSKVMDLSHYQETGKVQYLENEILEITVNEIMALYNFTKRTVPKITEMVKKYKKEKSK